MREPLPILIFGDINDEQIVRLKCWLLKCGICNFSVGRMERCEQGKFAEAQAGLFIISRASVNLQEVEKISARARRLAVPVLQL
jgi:hypothetical protein